MAARIGAVEEMVAAAGEPGYWRDKRVLVTGATGVVGSWVVKALLEHGAQVAAFVLDATPQSELFRSGGIHKVAVVNGRLENLADVERALSLHEIETVFHLAAQTIVPASLRDPLATFEASLLAQNCSFVAGRAANRQPGCWCQKQPCTKMAAR